MSHISSKRALSNALLVAVRRQNWRTSTLAKRHSSMVKSHWSSDMKQYKAVFIDWDDTIGDFLGAAKLALQDMYEKYNLSEYFASFEEFFLLYKPHNIELWDKYGKDLVTKEYLSFDRFFFPLMHGSKVSPRIQSYTTLHNPTPHYTTHCLIVANAVRYTCRARAKCMA